ncbi:hypothetical protein B0H14DRAFT_2568697 [Mycena olivaceomarginata]|nr:hypothetical protein B0H14DRAFT_2568697 [Mycena olivaceomarginata]
MKKSRMVEHELGETIEGSSAVFHLHHPHALFLDPAQTQTPVTTNLDTLSYPETLSLSPHISRYPRCPAVHNPPHACSASLSRLMPGTVEELVELLPQRAAARESGQLGSAHNWFLRGWISRIEYCSRPYLELHGLLIVPTTMMSGGAEEKDLERFAAGGRVEGSEGFICEGGRPNHGKIVPVAVVPLPHRLTLLEVLAVVKTVCERWNEYSLLGKNCYWLCATLLDALHLRASGTGVPTSPSPSRVVGRRFIGAPGITTFIQHDIDDDLSSLRAALELALHQELQRAAPPSSVVASHAVVQRERLRARPTFSLRAEVAQLRTEVCMLTLKAKLFAGMRAATVCLQPGTRAHLPGPSNSGLAGVSWGVFQRPGEDEEAALKAEIHRLQDENAGLLSSIQAAAQALNDMVGSFCFVARPRMADLRKEAGQIEDEEDEISDGSTELEAKHLVLQKCGALPKLGVLCSKLQCLGCIDLNWGTGNSALSSSTPKIALRGLLPACGPIELRGPIVETLLERHCVKHIVPPGANQFHQSLANEGNGEGRPFSGRVISGFLVGHLNGGRSIETLEFQPDWELAKVPGVGEEEELKVLFHGHAHFSEWKKNGQIRVVLPASVAKQLETHFDVEGKRGGMIDKQEGLYFREILHLSSYRCRPESFDAREKWSGKSSVGGGGINRSFHESVGVCGSATGMRGEAEDGDGQFSGTQIKRYRPRAITSGSSDDVKQSRDISLRNDRTHGYLSIWTVNFDGKEQHVLYPTQWGIIFPLTPGIPILSIFTAPFRP